MKNGLMSAQVQEGVWLPLLDYAHRKGLSLSTLRRYIKACKVTFRSEGGRYLIWDPMGQAVNGPATGASAADQIEVMERLRRAESELRKAREEIAELKTLIAFYEDAPNASI